MSRDKILQDIANDEQYKDYCRYVCNGRDVWKDLYQYVFLYVCELPEDKILEIAEGSIEWYIKRVMYMSANYKTTPFYKEYVGKVSISDEPLNINIKDDTFEELDNESWRDELRDNINDTLNTERNKNDEYSWEIGLFELWMNSGDSIREIARKTRIRYPTVRYHISALKKKINENTSNNE